ncbi:hypothetical protein [Pasteuria penetrans]|uniref:hypothetical protein n=1 Tax=Pasteuria penetrans TaxID=86005 RepID=UPI00165A814C|nr:hypothetical protein [Pasteuria penetrans]
MTKSAIYLMLSGVVVASLPVHSSTAEEGKIKKAGFSSVGDSEGGIKSGGMLPEEVGKQVSGVGDSGEEGKSGGMLPGEVGKQASGVGDSGEEGKSEGMLPGEVGKQAPLGAGDSEEEGKSGGVLPEEVGKQASGVGNSGEEGKSGSVPSTNKERGLLNEATHRSNDSWEEKLTKLQQELEVKAVTPEELPSRSVGSWEEKVGREPMLKLNEFLTDKGMKLNKKNTRLLRFQIKEGASAELLRKMPGDVTFVSETEIVDTGTGERKGLLFTSMDSSAPPMVELEKGGTDDLHKYSSKISGGRFKRLGVCEYACGFTTGAGGYGIGVLVSRIHPVTRPFGHLVGVGVAGLTGVGSTYICDRFCS